MCESVTRTLTIIFNIYVQLHSWGNSLPFIHMDTVKWILCMQNKKLNYSPRPQDI